MKLAVYDEVDGVMVTCSEENVSDLTEERLVQGAATTYSILQLVV